MLRKLSCPSELAVRDRATSPINYTCSTDAGFQWCSFQTIFQPEAAAKYKVSPLATIHMVTRNACTFDMRLLPVE